MSGSVMCCSLSSVEYPTACAAAERLIVLLEKKETAHVQKDDES